MCGRINIYDHSGIQELTDQVSVPVWPDFTPRYNIAPSENIHGLILQNGCLQMQQLKWGLIPTWAKPGQFSSPLFNARAETIHQKASFKKLIKKQRVAVPINGFYEWKRVGKSRSAFFIKATEAKAFFLAGIYQHLASGQSQCSLITTNANKMMSEIHSRMPAIIQAPDIERWLTDDTMDSVNELLLPVVNKMLTAHRVSEYVNNARNQGKRCIQPL